MAERPTPLTIAVCTLIAFQSDPESPLYELKREEGADEALIRLVNEFVLQGWSFSVSTHKSRIRHLLARIEAAVGPEVSSLLLDYLRLASSSIDSLVDLVISLQKAIDDELIDGSSPRGVFVRKVILGFGQLSFECTARLWQAFNNEIENLRMDVAVAEPERQSSRWQLSPDQIEEGLRKQCILMESSAQQSFEETELELQRILASDPDLPSAHFLRFLNCLRHGERVGAIDALHQYFDYALIEGPKAVTAPSGTGKKILQYAAILLAVLHHSFGDQHLSLKATEEAVAVAQESGDSACVAYALGWLHLNQSGLDAEQLLQKCSSRAEDIRTLVAGANMSLTQHFLSNSDAPIAHAWESLGDALSVRPNSTSTDLDRPTDITKFTSSHDAMVILAKQVMIGAGIWESCGLQVLSGLSSLVALRCYSDSLTAQDVSLAAQNISRVALYGPPEALQCLESRKADHNASSRYATAMERLVQLDTLDQTSPTRVATASLVLHEWAICRCDLAQAELLTGVLHSSLHSRLPNYVPVLVETLSHSCLLLRRQKQWVKAYHLSKKLCEVCAKEGMRTQHAINLIQLALIQLESSPTQFIGALPPLLECLSICERSSMDVHHAMALSVLAQVQLRLRNTKRAIALLKAALPILLQQAHVSFAGDAHLTLAKCHLQRAKCLESAKDRHYIIRILRSAAMNLDKSRVMFQEDDDWIRLKEVYYLQARVYNAMPEERQKRNEASRNFLKACEQVARPGRTTALKDGLGLLKHSAHLARLIVPQKC